MQAKRERYSIFQLFSYVLGFLLLSEWLRPLPIITDTAYIHIFVLFTSLLFLLTLLRLQWWLSSLLKSVATLVGIHTIFFEGSFFDNRWLLIVVQDVFANLGMIVQGDWYGMTDLFRSVLFFILLSIMSYLLFYWIVYVKRVFFFFICTVLYITLIDTFTAYDASLAIIRIFIAGFMLSSLLHMQKLQPSGQSLFQQRVESARWLLVVSFVIVCAVIMGVISPKQEAQWADPVPYLQSVTGLADAGAGKTIGYSRNDQHLGGSLAGDEDLVFYVKAERAHYWRGESKDYYTGKGWTVSTPSQPKTSESFAKDAVMYERLKATIMMEPSSHFYQFFYYGQFVDASHQNQAIKTRVDANTEKAEIAGSGLTSEFDEYEVTYDYPHFSNDALQSDEGLDPYFIKRWFLQLPDSLPGRVQQLAERIVSGSDNRYEKAKAIESYFAEEGYAYETNDVPTPKENQDYVDQFLFDTRRGYCDNFSTAMVVLLRSVDIPARWVKGFTSGEAVEVLDDNQVLYAVANENAHSWVEVYFPNVGWVPFEPTTGFAQQLEFISDDTELADDQQLIEEGLDESEEETETGEKNNAEHEDGRVGYSESTLNGDVKATIFLLLLLSLSLVLVLLKSKQIKRTIMLYRYQKRDDEHVFREAYIELLQLLKAYRLERRAGETLREYAKRIDETLHTDEMERLTTDYEKLYYGSDQTSFNWSSQHKLWVALIRKLSS